MEIEIKVIFDVDFIYTPGDPGRLSGPPENCYPPEGPDVDVVSVALGDKDIPLKNIPNDVMEDIINEIIETKENE